MSSFVFTFAARNFIRRQSSIDRRPHHNQRQRQHPSISGREWGISVPHFPQPHSPNAMAGGGRERRGKRRRHGFWSRLAKKKKIERPILFGKCSSEQCIFFSSLSSVVVVVIIVVAVVVVVIFEIEAFPLYLHKDDKRRVVEEDLKQFGTFMNRINIFNVFNM